MAAKSRLCCCNILALAAALLASLLPAFAIADVTTPVLQINAEAASATITTQTLRGNISVLMGSGGNIGVLDTPNGKLMVDSGIAVSKERVSAALAALGPEPVNFVVNTHYHWDHTDGNAWLHATGTTIAAHENTWKRLESGTRVIDWGYTFPPSEEGALPTLKVQEGKDIAFGDETVELRHFGSGHTDTDLVVYFRKADVLHMGDIWWNGHYPFIDYGAGGSIDGMIRWTNKCLSMISARTVVIPGHGPVGDRSQLVAYRDMLVSVRESVARLKRKGKTLAEVQAARPTAEFDAQYGDFVIDPAFFIQLVYTGV